MEIKERISWKVFVALGLISASVVAFEIILLRIFSFTIWHHFAFMVISISLLGFGVAGVLFQFWPRLGNPPLEKAGRFALAFSLSIFPAVLYVNRIPFDPQKIGRSPLEMLIIPAYYVVLLIPFTFAGLAVIILVNGFKKDVGRVYGSDLIGAGAGSFVIMGLLGTVGVEKSLALLSVAAAVSAIILNTDREKGIYKTLWPSVLWGIAGLLIFSFSGELVMIQPGPGKALKTFLDRKKFPGAATLHEEWNAHSRIDVIARTALMTWTVNPYYPKKIPDQIQIVIDGDATTPLIRFQGNLDELDFLDYGISSVGYQAFSPRRSLIIGSGGGLDVLMALRYGGKSIDAVEINPAIVHLVEKTYKDYIGGIFQLPEVNLYLDEGRSFMRGRKDAYDIIQLSMIDTWAAAASGAYSLSESYLYTVEAFREYLRHLNPKGILTITRWEWTPPREALKLCTTAVEALKEESVQNPEDHVIFLTLKVPPWTMGNVCIKKTPFTTPELDEIKKIASRGGFELVYMPGSLKDNPFVQFFRTRDPHAYLSTYPYDIVPATDDKPFFFQFGRWQKPYLFGRAWKENVLVLSGRLILVVVLIQAVVLSVVLLGLPAVLRSRNRGKGKIARRTAYVLGYFFVIGIAFMLIEVALMQRFTLYLGSPVAAVSVILASLLISAGMGSRYALRIFRSQRLSLFPFGLLAGIAALYAFLLPSFFNLTLSFYYGWRVTLSILLLLPIGFLMGFPMPKGLARLGDSARSLVGWAWGSNGCASVIGPVLASMLAMEMGFTRVFIIGSLGYLLASCLYKIHWD